MMMIHEDSIFKVMKIKSFLSIPFLNCNADDSIFKKQLFTQKITQKQPVMNHACMIHLFNLCNFDTVPKRSNQKIKIFVRL